MCHLYEVQDWANNADSVPSILPPTSHHRRPWFPSPLSTLLSIPLQQWLCQLSSLLTKVNKLMSILLAQKSKQHFSCTQRCSSSLCNLLFGQRHAVICSAGFGKVRMSPKPPALLLPATLQLNFFANLFFPGYCFKFRNEKLDSQTLFLHHFVFSLYFERCTRCWRDLLCSHALCLFCTPSSLWKKPLGMQKEKLKEEICIV